MLAQRRIGQREAAPTSATRQTGGVAIAGSAEFLITQNAAGRDAAGPDGP